MHGMRVWSLSDMISDEGLNVSCCQIQETKNYVALCAEDIFPNLSKILAEAKDVDDILVDFILVQIQAEARVGDGIWEDQIASNLVSNVLIVQCVMYHNVCIFQLNDSKHWTPFYVY